MMILALASMAALAALIVHSFMALSRSRAAAFWGAAVVYALVRGIGVRFVTEGLLGARAPYVMHEGALTLAGVPAQEIVGWALVAYLGWYLGSRFSRSLDEGASPAGVARARAPRPNAGSDARTSGRANRAPRARRDAHADAAPAAASARLFPQVLWACLFLGAIGWTIETAAAAAGWWHWTLPGSALLLGVPAIGLVDWAFVGIDFLLPFLLLTSPALAGTSRAARGVALGAFPLHFLAHASVGGSSGPWRALGLFLAHAGLFGIVLWLALGSRARDVSFDAGSHGGRSARTAPRWLPLFSLGLVLGVPVGLEALVLGRPGLLVSIVPSALVAVASFAPVGAVLAGAASAGLFWISLPLALAAVPAAAVALLRWAPPERRVRRAVAVLVVAGLVGAAHLEGVRRESVLRTRLEAALEVRDRGDLVGAVLALRQISADFPSSHAPRLLLGEIAYRRGDLSEARDAFEAAVAIKPDATMAHRYLAAVALQEGDPSEASAQCARGLTTAPDDPDLLYLASVARAQIPSIRYLTEPTAAR